MISISKGMEIMTIKLYEQDVYIKENTANIVDRVEKDNKKYIVLDKTIFFPEGGGQPSDTGFIDSVRVSYVMERENKVYHLVEEFPKGNVVKCVIDWDRRFDHMQQHCGEHILSGVFYKLYGAVNKGFHMGKDMVTIDMDIQNVTNEMILEIEEEANRAIYENALIKTDLVHSQEEAKRFPLRKEMTVYSDIRIVQVENFDCVACCGTHPQRAGEVGIIKIYKAEKNKGMTRVYFKCGKRALSDYQYKNSIISDLMQNYSSDLASLYNKICAESEKYEGLKKEFKNLKKIQNDMYISNVLYSDDLVDCLDDKDMDDLKYMVKSLTDDEFKNTIFLASKKDNGVILVSNEHNCGQIFKDYIKSYNGRGGGSTKMAQGTFSKLSDMMEFFDYIKGII